MSHHRRSFAFLPARRAVLRAVLGAAAMALVPALPAVAQQRTGFLVVAGNHPRAPVGADQVRVWHLNDSRRECGSRVDRHAGIGRGRLGLEPFRNLVNDPRFAAVPMILETPKGTEDGEPLDAINLRVLRQPTVE